MDVTWSPTVIDTAKRQRDGKIPESRVEDFQALVSINADAMVVLDHEGYVLYVNPAAEFLFNLPRAEMVGANFGFPLILDKPVELHILRELKDLVAAEMRLVEVAWAGEPCYLLSFRDMTDRIVAEQEMSQNVDKLNSMVDERTHKLLHANERLKLKITESKRIEKALVQSEQHVNDILNSIQDGFFELDREYRYTFINQRAARNSGLEPEDHIGNCIWDMFPYARGTQFEAVYREAMDTRRPAHFEIKNPSREQYYDISVYPSAEGISVFWKDITERKRAEEALATAYRQFQSVIDNTPDIVYAFDLEERFVLANTACAALLNSTPEQMIGKRRHEFMPRKDADWHEANDRQAIEAGRALEFEEYSQLKGRSITWLTKKFPLRDAQGRIYAVSGISADISERKRAEEALRKQYEYTARLLTSISDGLYVYDRDWRYMYVNPRGLEIAKKTREEIVGGTLWEVFPYVNGTEIERRFRHSMVNNVPDMFEYYYEPLDIWVEYRIYPTPDGLMEFVTDITERKRVESEREHLLSVVGVQRARLQAILDSLPVGVWVADATSKMIMVNDAARDIWGGNAPKADSLGEYSVYKVWHPETGEPVKAEDMPLSRAIMRGEVVKDMVIDFERFDGSYGTQLASATPIRDSQGNITGGVVIALDITMLKRTEEALKDAKQQAELYLDLMGHDISNMHQIAMGYLEMAREIIPADEAQKELIEKPLEVMQRSAQLIDNVRKLQQGRSGNFKLEVYDLDVLIDEVAARFKDIPDKEVKIEISSVKGIRVQADELLRDVFINLIGNAIKHTKGPVLILIWMVKNDRFCRIMIDDNGPGIPDDMKNKIFNRLKLDGLEARGTGLGLFIVKSLVESYKGHVWADDRVKGDHTKGARFVVMLPIVEQ